MELDYRAGDIIYVDPRSAQVDYAIIGAMAASVHGVAPASTPTLCCQSRHPRSRTWSAVSGQLVRWRLQRSP